MIASMIRARPAAIIFDMDGLLLDTERLYRDAIIAAAAGLGFVISETLFLSLVGVPEDGNRRQLAEALGAAFPFDRYRDAYRAGVAARIETEGVPLRPGAAAIVATTGRLGLPMAIATSTGRALATAHLAAAGLLDAFDHVLTRDDVARGKPWPDVYLAAAAALGVTPSNCLALEDSHNGVRAAHAAGMPVIMVPDLLPPTDEMRALTLAIAPDLDVVGGWLQAAVAGMAPA